MKSKVISMVGRKDKKSFVVTPQEPLTSPVKKKFLKDTEGVDVQFSEKVTPLSPDVDNRPRVKVGDGKTYVEMIQSSTFSVYVDETPERPKVERRVKFGHLRQRLFEPVEREEKFEFEVTADDVVKRLKLKRPCTQKQVTGFSAKEKFEEYGAMIVGYTKEYLIQFHLAHRQGWALGGSQSKENLDPSTAGSNYATLFTIESPLVNLLLQDDIESINVLGVVHYREDAPIPYEITYSLFWGNGRTATVSVFPLNFRTPTLDEHSVAKATFSATRTPQRRSSKRKTTHPAIADDEGREETEAEERVKKFHRCDKDDEAQDTDDFTSLFKP
jgi:hypothetical protein